MPTSEQSATGWRTVAYEPLSTLCGRSLWRRADGWPLRTVAAAAPTHHATEAPPAPGAGCPRWTLSMTRVGVSSSALRLRRPSMGEFVVKAAPDVDLYLIWSTVVDSACYVGTRAEIREHLWDEHRGQHPHELPPLGYSPDDRMVRTDQHGTSALDPPGLYSWSHEAFHVGEASPCDGRWWELPRTNLVAYAKAIIADDEVAAHALLHPIEFADGEGPAT